jgi:hypothetical protein
MNARLICNRSSRHMEHVTMSYLAPCSGMSIVHGLPQPDRQGVEALRRHLRRHLSSA